MPRYWVIAPVESKPPENFDKVWQFDVANSLISIGWYQLGDVSTMSRDELSDAVAAAYPDKPPQTKGLYSNMIWAFYHEIAPGDVVIARRGRKILAGVGKVIQSAIYAPAKNPANPGHPNFLKVEWQPQASEKVFPTVVFPMPTLAELSEAQYHSILEDSFIPTEFPITSGVTVPIEDRNEFVLEKYLEEFIVSNFKVIFKGMLKIYEDTDVNDGQQYATEVGPIDILAVESKSNSFIVIELKKGRSSDQVVGQTLRYMGWVKKNLCTAGQDVKGLVICREPDPKLTYALSMTNNIDVRYYSVSFKLSEAP